MSDAETTIARWDALTYDGSAPGRNVPSLHIYLRPSERSGETPGAARRLFQDFISRFYSGPPFLTPLEKLRDTANYALEEAKRSRGDQSLDKIQIAVAILDRAEGEMHLFRNGPVRLGLDGYRDEPCVESSRLQTIGIGTADGLALLDGTLTSHAIDSIEERGDHGRLIFEGRTAGIWIPISLDGATAGPAVRAEKTAPPPAETVREETAPVEERPRQEEAPPVSVEDAVFRAAVPPPVVDERESSSAVLPPLHEDEQTRPAPIRNPFLLVAIFLLISLVTFFWNRERGRVDPLTTDDTVAETGGEPETPFGSTPPSEGEAPIQNRLPAGELLWEFTAGAAVTSSPLVHDGRITVGCRDGNVYSLSAAGEEVWRASGPGGVGSSPVVWEDRIIFGEYGGAVVAVEKSTGAELWRHETGAKIVSTPACADGLVFIGSFDKSLHALDAATGEEVWNYRTGDAIWSSPQVAGESVVVGSLDRNVYGVRRSDGALLWRVRTAGPIYGSPAVEGEDIFIGCRGGTLYRINAATGGTVWSAEIGQSIHSTVAVREDRLVFGVEEGSVICLSRETGELLWSFPTGARVPSSPVVRNGVVYVGSYDRYIYALDMESGHPLWRKEVGGSVYSSIRLSDSALYVGTNQGRLVALSLGPAGESP